VRTDVLLFIGVRKSPLHDAANKPRFAFDIRIAIIWKTRGERLLQASIVIPYSTVCSQVVAKTQMFVPERASDRGEVHVVRTRVPTPEEFSSRDTLVAAMHVTAGDDALNIRLDVGVVGEASENVQDGLCEEARHGRAADVLKHDREWRQRAVEPTCLG
jgi:hypothetical protein